jgi:hypothetical protein
MDQLLTRRPATVIVFWSTGCPCVRRYQQRVDALVDHYGDRITMLAVSSNAGESMADVLRVARERGVKVPLMRDEGGRLARAIGARTTPTAAVFDQRGELRFLGWIDNEREPGDPAREPWLERAIEGVLEGRNDFVTRTPIFGCAITRSLFGGSQAPCCSHPQPESRRSP